MEADKRRRIKDGKAFDHLFPPPLGIDKSIKGNASVEDTLKLIQETVPDTLWHTKEIARRLKGRTLDETCSNIWHFVYEHIQYKRDKDGVEQIRSPRRTWWERNVGVDCDCYTEFILSILLNLNIPCKARIAKYRKKPPEIPRWQHIYPIVPRSGRIDADFSNRDEYIVLDCVKDQYDDEQEFLEAKDYDMRLEYLDGLDEETTDEEDEYSIPVEFDNVDVEDFAIAYGYDGLDELGFLKKLRKKIGSAVKKVGNKVGSAVKTVAKNIKKTAPILVKKVGDEIGKGVRFINRYVNPATILIRNGFLLSMKLNLMNVAKRLRYAYLSDAQALKMGINPASLAKLRKVKDKAETVYWQAGGKKSNLKKAILSGKGNKDKKVQLSGLFGLDDVYMDMDEYRIIHTDYEDLQGLGEVASGTSIAAAAGAVAAIATTLSQIKDLFKKGSPEDQAFQSESDDAGVPSEAPAMIPDDEEQILIQEYSEAPNVPVVNPYAVTAPAYAPAPSFAPATTYAREIAPLPTTTETTNTPSENKEDDKKKGLMVWVKENPGTSLLIAGGVVAGSYVAINALRGSRNSNSLNGVPQHRKKKKRKRSKKQRIQSIKL